MLRIQAEFVEGFGALAEIGPAITVFGSARTPADSSDYSQAEELGAALHHAGYAVITGGGPGIMEAATDRRLSDDDAAALVAVRLRKDDQELQRARTLVALPASAEATGTARARISDQAKIFVWQRDRGQCVNCQTNQDLEFDHVIPLVMGGSNTERNLQLLCGACNRDKGGNLV